MNKEFVSQIIEILTKVHCVRISGYLVDIISPNFTDNPEDIFLSLGWEQKKQPYRSCFTGKALSEADLWLYSKVGQNGDVWSHYTINVVNTDGDKVIIFAFMEIK